MSLQDTKYIVLNCDDRYTADRGFKEEYSQQLEDQIRERRETEDREKSMSREYAKQLVSEGLIPAPVMVQLCMGIPWGAPDDLNTFMAMVNNVPPDWIYSAFSIGRHQMPYVAAAVLSGANVRVGLEDNLWLGKGRLATNAELVEHAVTIIEAMGVRIMTPEEVRAELQLTKRALP